MRSRNFTWADLPELADLITRIQRSSEDARRSNQQAIREELSPPGLDPEANCTLYNRRGELCAYSLVKPELAIGRAVLEMGIAPGWEDHDLESRVITRALARARVLGAQVLHVCVPPTEAWRWLLEEEGFSLARRYWLLTWTGDAPPQSDEPPQGFRVESFRPGEGERLAQVQNAAFGGSWGFCPNTVEEIVHRAAMGNTNPEGILFLATEDDTAAYCWTLILEAEGAPIGVIGMIGVTPQYRGRALSKPILVAGMRYLHSRGVEHIRLNVDHDNGPALRLYDSVGFQRSQELHWFEAPLSEG